MDPEELSGEDTVDRWKEIEEQVVARLRQRNYARLVSSGLNMLNEIPQLHLDRIEPHVGMST